jgi:hypothetical protein
VFVTDGMSGWSMGNLLCWFIILVGTIEIFEPNMG